MRSLLAGMQQLQRYILSFFPFFRLGVKMREPKIICICGREVCLEIVGGQHLNAWTGRCECGRIWSLEEMSEILAEISGEERTADMLVRLGIKVF